MRYALGLNYCGQTYQGWQSQPSGNTIQNHLEKALSTFADVPIQAISAGRTDAGVHALMQVVHFDTPVQREAFSWMRGTNSFLPPDISVQWAQVVPPEFHARASALARRYVYVVLESAMRPGVQFGRVGWSFRPLDGDLMRLGAQHLFAEHDFSSFRAAGCQSPTPVKTIHHIHVRRQGSYWYFEFQANAFLHHMIRNIMGCLLWVGQGLKPPNWIAEVLAARNRDAAAPTFCADGLYFLGPIYEPHWGLPEYTPDFGWLGASS